MSSLLPGWANTTTPFYAGVRCGNVTQTDTYTTTGTQPVAIGFTDPATWSDTQSFTTEDDVTWECQTSGVYNLKFNQTVDVTDNYTPPASSVRVTPNTTFYLDVSGTLLAPAVGSLLLAKNPGAVGDITHTAVALETDVLMGTFTTPAGFLSSTNVPGADWDIVVNATTSGTTSADLPPTRATLIAQYYKTTSQNAPTGVVEVTFDGTADWNNTNGYITHTNGTIGFTCQQTGVYQLEFATTVSANGSTWTNQLKTVAIHITRIGVAEQTILINRFDITSPNNWGNSVVGTVKLEAGDVIHCVVNHTISGTALILGVSGVFDYNTTFTVTVIEELENSIAGMNSLYYSVFEVDADGTSNPVTILDGSTVPATVINSTDNIYYHLIQKVPPFIVASLTKRIQIKVFSNFYTASLTRLFIRGAYIPTASTTISQQDLAPLTRDTVIARITVTSATDEFDQVFASSIPVVMSDGEFNAYSTSVNAIANVYAGDTIQCTLVAVEGNVIVSSGETSLPAPANTLQWNLLAEGSYGNATVVLAPPPEVGNLGIQDL